MSSALERHIHTKNTGVSAATVRGHGFGSDLVVSARDGGANAPPSDPHGVIALERSLALLASLPTARDVHLCDMYDRTALWHAADTGQQPLVVALLRRGASATDVDKAGWSCLHVAAEKGYRNIIELLIEAGADVDARTAGGPAWTPLHLACSSGMVRATHALLQAGAAVSDLTTDGWTPLLLCGMGGRSGHKAVAEMLIEYGADPNTADPADGETTLHKACRNGQEELATMLINRGAAITLDKAGVTPLAHALAWNFDWEISGAPRRRGGGAGTKPKILRDAEDASCWKEED